MDGCPQSAFLKFLFYIGVELINNVVIVSGVQQSDSVIHIHVSILFQILFPWGRINWEFGIDIYTPLYLKWVANENLLYSTGNSAQSEF